MHVIYVNYYMSCWSNVGKYMNQNYLLKILLAKYLSILEDDLEPQMLM